MLNFKQYITEALPLSTAKKYTKHFDRTRYDNIFNGKYRIYIPLNKTEEAKIKPNNLIDGYLKSKGYTIDNYLQGYASKKDSKNIYKIGGLLNDNPDLKKEFDNDPIRAAARAKKNDMLIVISRHPYDIAGMSSNRGWTSCMSLGVADPKTGKTEYGMGSMNKFVMNDVKEGTLVAYLIKNDDKNIQSPLARLLIKPFINALKKSNDIILVPETKIYPAEYEKFTPFYDTVEKWCDIQNNKMTEGYFRIKNNLYCDSDIAYSIKKVGNHAPLKAEELIKIILKRNITKQEKEEKIIVSNETKIILDSYIENGKLAVDLSEWEIKVSILKVSNITSFQNFPKKVDGVLLIENSNFEDLQGIPYVEKSIDFQKSKVKSLKGIQRGISGDFDCSNLGLDSLEGGPTSVTRFFKCENNNLTSLKGCPQSTQYFNCSGNKLTNLKYAPRNLETFICSNNQLTTLEGGPEYVLGNYNCSNNQLASLNGAPKRVGELNCSNNKLTDFTGAPSIVMSLLNALNNPLKSIKGIPEEIGWVIRVSKDVPENVIKDLEEKFPNELKIGNP